MSKAAEFKIVALTEAERVALLGRIRGLLSAGDYELIAGLIQGVTFLLRLLETAKMSITRLRRLVFGAKTETRANLLSRPGAPPAPDPAAAKPKPKGHGRKGARAYPGALRIKVPHPVLAVGGLCLQCLKGKLYQLKPPALLVYVTAQPLFQATLYELARLRCALCGAVFTAPAPAVACQGKYAPNVGIMLGLMRFGSGLPHYRMEKMQRDFGVPLPQSTQWELMAESAKDLEPIGHELSTVAAGGELLHNDDTPMRVQSLKKDKAASGSERTGIFTTGVVAKVGDHQVALFFTGGNHAGENLDLLLQHRSPELGKPIQMCDALSRNRSKEFEVLLANCLPHGRRGFVDVAENFPAECQQVLESLGEVFKNDAEAKKLNLPPQERLRLHAEQSGPVMQALHDWMKAQIDQRKVEPNSGLGEAIQYMLNHWEPLTLFLRVAGAPLSNNLCERALKMAILHRKNSLGYKTENGARVGDLFMSLIHTCRLNALNPFDYLSALQRHAAAVKANPGQWLPWNYHQTLASLSAG